MNFIHGSNKKLPAGNTKNVYAPVSGNVMPITQSADPAHQQEIVGKGVCFMPVDNKIVAPFNGVVDMIFETKHAVAVKSDDGIELLIHCGIDTVKLGGKGFLTYVKDGDKVKKNQLILEYDRNTIENAGYSVETQVVVTNVSDYKSITQVADGSVAAGDLILTIR